MLGSFHPLEMPERMRHLTSWQKFFVGFGPFCPRYKLSSIIAEQLRIRDSTAIEMWPADPALRKVAMYVATQIKEWMEWPNDYFLPDDPCCLLFYDESVDMRGVECLSQIERDFQLPQRVFDNVENLHLSELVDMVLEYGTSSP